MRAEQYALPEAWVWANLNELIQELESGGRPKGGVRGIRQGVPSVGGEHLNESGGFNFSATRFVPESFAASMTKGWIRPLDILVVKDGATTGKTSLVDDHFPCPKAVLNEHVFRLRAFHEVVDQQYLFRFLWGQTGQRMIAAAFRGTAQGGINQSFPQVVDIPLAPLSEQRRIVAKIEALFEQSRTARQALDRIPPLLKKFRQAVLAAAFRGDLTRDWREHNPDVEPASTLLERVRAERRRKWEADLRTKGKGPRKAKYIEAEPVDIGGLPRIPKGWEWTNIDALISGARYGTSQKCTEKAEGVPVLRIPNVVKGRIDLADLKFAYFQDEALKTLLVQPGDLLVVRTNGSLDLVGRAALVPELRRRYAFASYLIRLRPVFDSTLARYIDLVFFSDLARRLIEVKARSTAGQFNLNRPSVSNCRTVECQQLSNSISVSSMAVNHSRRETAMAKKNGLRNVVGKW